MSVETGNYETPMARRARVARERTAAAFKRLGIKAEPEGEQWRVTLGNGDAALDYDQAGFHRFFEMLRESLNILPYLQGIDTTDPGTLGRHLVPQTVSLRLDGGRGALLFKAGRPVTGRTVDAHLRVLGTGEVIVGTVLGQVESLARLPEPLKGILYPEL